MADIHHIAVGANHRSAPLELRERLFVAREETAAFYDAMRHAGLREALLLSTCDRVEVHAVSDDPQGASARLRERLASQAGEHAAVLEQRGYGLAGDAALRQLFAIAASLDSLVVGEPQVLGQLKESHRRAAEAGMIGPVLERRLQAAYGAAKRVRNETAIGERPVSIASSAVEVARELHGDLSRVSALMLGAGEGGELIAERLKANRLGALSVAHRSPALARAVAERLGANLSPLDDLDGLLAAADIVVLAVGSGAALTRSQVERALKARRRRPMLIIDAGVPADAEPAIHKIDDAFLYGLDDLERIALSGRARREGEADAAWAIVTEELARFGQDRAERGAVPALAALRARFEAARLEVLAQKTGTDSDEATRRLVARLLHDPSESLRALAAEDPEAARAAEALLARLFRLENER
jgi:glutamyl-tRNA reductase